MFSKPGYLRVSLVYLDRVDFAAEGAVNTVLGNEDAPAQAELLAEGTLPEHDRLWVGDGGELVIQNNLIFEPRNYFIVIYA